jgi:hypothetical protein
MVPGLVRSPRLRLETQDCSYDDWILGVTVEAKNGYILPLSYALTTVNDEGATVSCYILRSLA